MIYHNGIDAVMPDCFVACSLTTKRVDSMCVTKPRNIEESLAGMKSVLWHQTFFRLICAFAIAFSAMFAIQKNLQLVHYL